MATRYWVGGTGIWDATDTTNWSATSGGAGGASVPTSTDDVIFDANSNITTGTFTVTFTGLLASPSRCASLTVSGLDGAMTLTGGGANAFLEVYGNVSFPATNMSVSGTGSFILKGTGSHTLTTNGVSLSGLNLLVYGTGTYTLGSALTLTGAIDFQNGVFDTSSTGNYSITTAFLVIQGSAAKTLNLNGSTLTFSSGTTSFSYTGSGLTFNAGTSTIVCSSANGTFAGGGLTFYNVSFTGASAGSAQIIISGTNTYNNLLFTSPTAVTQRIVLNENITVNGTLTLGSAGVAARRISLFSATTATQTTITLNGTLAALSDVDFRGIIAAGTVATPWTGTRLGNCYNNQNITFTAAATKYWNLAAGGTWNSTAWALSSGGTVNANNFPLPQDTAIIENSNLNTGATITLNGVYNLPTIDMSSRTNAMYLSSTTASPRFCGDLTLGTGVTPICSAGTFFFVGVGRTQTITSNGRTFQQGIEFDAHNGTFILTDDFVSNNGVDITGASGTGSSVTFTFATQPLQPFPSTGTLVVTGVTPSAYNGAWTITAATTTSVTVTSTVTSAYVGGGFASSPRNVTFSRGTLNLNNKTLTAFAFVPGNTNTRSIAFGSTGKVNVLGWATTVYSCENTTNFSYTGTPRIEFTYTGNAGTRIITPHLTGATENNCLDYYISSGSDIVAISSNRAMRSLDFTGFTGILNNFATTNLTIYGNLVLASGMTLSTSVGGWTFAGTSGTSTLTMNGKSFESPVFFDGLNKSWMLQDAMNISSSGNLNFYNGTLRLKAGTTNTVGAYFSTSGTTMKYLESTDPGQQATISDSSGTNTVTYLSIRDSNATGGALWDASSATNLDNHNNTGWTIYSVPAKHRLTNTGNLLTKTYFDEGSELTSFGSYGFNGTDSYLTVPDSDAWALGQTFTIEFWIYLNSYSAPGDYYTVVSQYTNASINNSAFYLSIGETGIPFFVFCFGTSISSNQGSLLNVPVQKWTHVAFSCQSLTPRYFIDGVLDTTVGGAVSGINNSSIPLTIGRLTSTDGKYLNGYVSNLRITRNTALYTASFTPPTKTLTKSSNFTAGVAGTQLLLNNYTADTPFKDNSNNNFTVSNNNVAVSTFAPPIDSSITYNPSFKTDSILGIMDEVTISGSPNMRVSNTGTIMLSGQFNEYDVIT